MHILLDIDNFVFTKNERHACRIFCLRIRNAFFEIYAHVCILCSQKGVSLSRIRITLVYGCLGVGQPSSSVVMGVEEVREEEVSFPGHISGPPRGWRSAVRRVAMLRAITDGQRGLPPRCEWKASSNG